MNVVSYGFRRAHRSMENTALSVFRAAAKTVKALAYMTPSRFDVLTAIAEKAWWTRKPGPRTFPASNVLPMSDLVQMLGLHHSTVTMIIRRMKKRELVVTEKQWSDRRTTVIKMTKDGWEALRAARALLRERPQNFLRAPLGEWFRGLGMRDCIGSIRTAQRWASTLATTFGLSSTPIHDPRCLLGWEDRRYRVYDELGRPRWCSPSVRRRSFG